MVKISEIDVNSRINSIKTTLGITKRQVDKCDVSPLTVRSLIEHFGHISSNLTLLEAATDEHRATEEQIKEMITLRNRYHELEEDFTYNCRCISKKNPPSL
jgi:hypothetical protein